MEDFNFFIPLNKSVNKNVDLIGIASTTSVDRDEEVMSEKALNMMVDDIRREGVNLFENHNHEWSNTLGVIKQADLVDNKVKIGINLDDPVTNPKIPALLNKLKKGIKLGLSVGGTVTKDRWEYDRELGKKIRVLDEVKIYEVSVVGIPSNSESFLTLPQAISKSLNSKKHLAKCPVCYTNYVKECPICLYQ
jgi:HK97 family phage prohead protease